MRRISGRVTVGAALLALVLACNPDKPVGPDSPAFDAFAEAGGSPDVVTEWNRNTLNAIEAEHTNPVITGRRLAIVDAAVFDAVNGIERRYIPYHVSADAPRGASRRAAAIQAAYVALVNLFPSQKATFDLERSASLASITDDGESEESESIARGIEWGEEVANDILAWRSTDGLNRPFNPPCPIPLPSSPAPGQWRPTPPNFRAAVFPEMACVTPFAMSSPSQFRPAGPPELGSDQYTRDFNEVKEVGSATSSTRTAEQTQIALFWADGAGTETCGSRIPNSLAESRIEATCVTPHI